MRSTDIFIGLMSGTSADGIDAVAARIRPRKYGLGTQVLGHIHRPFGAKMRRQILELSTRGTVAELCEMNFALGHEFAEAALDVLRKSNLNAAEVVAIGSHGQTVRHLPHAEIPSTLQIGESAVIAERTGIETIADFRVADMAAGGQGAPLVAFADWAILTDRSRPRIIQNIGGIANLTFLRAAGNVEDVIAFDTGPGNMLIDWFAGALSGGRLRLDLHGKWAAQGTVSTALLKEALRHAYFGRRPPKTTGREEFGEEFAQHLYSRARRLRLRPPDILATITALTAETIVLAYRKFVFHRSTPLVLPRLQVILGGGGARNLTLRRMLQDRLNGAELLTHADLGIDDAAKEALAFAVLARQTLHGKAGNVPAATGAERPVVLGKISSPSQCFGEMHKRLSKGNPI